MAEMGLQDTRDPTLSVWRVESALAECLASLAAAPSPEVDREIARTLERLCEVLGLDRAVVWQADPGEPQVLRPTHLWSVELPPVPDGISTNAYFPWITRQLLAGQEVVIQDVEALPGEASTDLESLRYFGARSTYVIPLKTAEGRVVGAVNFAATTRRREWTTEVLTHCRLVAQVMNGVMARRRADAALAQSEAAFRAIFEASSAAMAILDPDTTISMANGAYGTLLGRRPEEVVGTSWTQLIPPGDLERMKEYNRRRLTNPSSAPSDYEFTFYHSSGEVRTARIAIAWSPALGKLITSVLDVTEHRRAEAALRETKALLEAVFQSASDMIWSVDPVRFGLLTFNRALEQHFRVRFGTSIRVGDRPEELFPPGEFIPRWKEIYGRALREGPYRTEYLSRDGSSMLDLHVSPVVDEGRTVGVAVFGRNVTAQRQVEAQLRQAMKLESVGRLAGGVSHDFNNLLTVILANGSEVREALVKGEPVDLECIDELLGAGRRAADLTRHLLSFARKQVVVPETLDLSETVRDTLKLLGRLLGEDVRIAQSFEPGLWLVRFDRGQIGQVIMNLAINARDAMPHGGTLTVSASNVVIAPDAPPPVADLAPGPYVQLSVADTGQGMPPAVLEHVFEPFFTTKDPGKGTGLGLAMVFGIVKQAGGGIRVESQPGHGTRFDIYFPRAAAEVVPLPRAAGVEADPAGRGETVLVVEDDPQVLRVAVRDLARAGYDVIAASTLQEAMTRAAAHPRPPALLLTDVRMPSAGGPEVSAALSARFPGLRTVYMSGYPSEIAAPGGELVGHPFFVPKPFTAEGLVRHVREALDARLPAPGA